MPEVPNAADTPKKRSRGICVLWGVALTLLVCVATFCWLVVVPVLQVRSQLFSDSQGSNHGGLGQMVEELGGKEETVRKVRLYLWAPEWLTGGGRDRAAILLSKCGEPAVPLLRQLLKSDCSDARFCAARALRDIGTLAAPAAGDLAAALLDRNSEVRLQVELALGRLGSAAIAPVVAVLEGNAPPELTVCRALEAVTSGRLAVSDVDSVLTRNGIFLEPMANVYSLLLYLRLPRKHAPHKDAAAAAIAWLPEETDSDFLLAALADPDPVVRRRIAWALGRIGRRESSPAHWPPVLEAAGGDVGAVASTPAPEPPDVPGMAEAVRELLSDNDASVRFEAARALGRIAPKDAKTRAALLAVISDKDILVRMVAAGVLQEIAGKGKPAESVARVRQEIEKRGASGMASLIRLAYTRGHFGYVNDTSMARSEAHSLLRVLAPAEVHFCQAMSESDHYEVAADMDLGNLYGGRKNCVTAEGAKLLRNSGYVHRPPFLLVALPNHPTGAYVVVQFKAKRTPQ
jgi:HEAT repeat protein